MKLEDDQQGSEGSQPSESSQPRADAWCIVRLVSVTLPNATVELKTIIGDESHMKHLSVSVDELRAVSKAKDAPKVNLHPSLQECGEPLDPYDYECCRPSFTKAVAEHMLLWAHASTIACVERVAVSRLSVQGKLPFILQVRAKDAFK